VRLRHPGRARVTGGSKEPACSVPGRSVRPGVGQSWPGRRSDDGHMIVLPAQLGLERTAEQVVLNRQANLNRRPSPCHRTASSHEGNPASPAQPQGRTEHEDAMGRLTPDSGHEFHLAKVPVSTSGADSSAGALGPGCRPLNCWQLSTPGLSSPPATSPLTSSSPTRNSRSSWPPPTPGATATSPDPCNVTSHPRHRRRFVTPPAQTHRAASRAPDRPRTPANIRFCRK
jgi:hypothetical protein